MYTRCPHCSTIFRVTAAQLRAAFGEVSCGSCHTTFNALNALSDELPELTEAVVLDPLDTPATEFSRDDEPVEASTQDVAIEASESEDAAEEFDAIVIGTPDAGDNLTETGVDETGVDETVETGPSSVATGESASFEVGYEVEEPADATEEAPVGKPDAPLYDDDTGYEEELTTVGWDEEEGGEEAPHTETATDGLGSFTTGADDLDRREDHREPGGASGTTGDLAATGRGFIEPAYDDNTGIEEILAESEFDAADDGDDSAPAREQESIFEFNAPEPAWSDIFEPTRQQSPVGTDPEPDEPLDLSPPSALESATADQNEWAGFLSELSPGETTMDEPAPEACDDYDEGPVIVLGGEDEVAVPTDVPEAAEVAADPLIDYEPEFVPPWESEPSEDDADEAAWKRPSNLHMAIAAALVLALGMQLIHYNRDSIATHPSWGDALRSVYGAFDHELYPNWDLAAYRISGSEAVAGRTAPAVLDIMASVVISGDHAVGLPMIRVALRDRWSNTVASRIFSPREYLRDSDTRPALISPGTTLPVEISVADPGAEAHGYVVDICLPRRASGMQCQNETDPFQQQ